MADASKVSGGARSSRIEDPPANPSAEDSRTSTDDEDEEMVFENVQAEVTWLRKKLNLLCAQVYRLQGWVKTDVESAHAEIEGLKVDMSIVKKAMASEPRVAVDSGSSRIRAPEPKSFGGARNAKELENFLWDMDEYFKAAKVADGEKVMIATMFLSGDAKLWWRSRVANDQNVGRSGIETWEALKAELKAQFLPHNVSWMARETLKRLKHTGTLREYVREYSSLMLDIQNMSEEDRLFNFLSGLQPWAQAELRRQAVKDLSGAVAAAEGLVDFPDQTSHGKGGNKGKGEPSEDKSGPTGKFKKAESGAPVASGVPKPKPSCWTCGGDHLRRNCPQNQKLNTVKETEPEENEEFVQVCSPLVLT